MNCNDGAYANKFQLVCCGDARHLFFIKQKCSKYQRAKQHPVKSEQPFIKLYQFAQDSSETGKDNCNMQLNEGFFQGCVIWELCFKMIFGAKLD